MFKTWRRDIPIFAYLLFLFMPGGPATPPPIPRSTALLSYSSVSTTTSPFPLSASRATVTTFSMTVLFVSLLFILVQLPLELVEVRHVEV